MRAQIYNKNELQKKKKKKETKKKKKTKLEESKGCETFRAHIETENNSAFPCALYCENVSKGEEKNQKRKGEKSTTKRRRLGACTAHAKEGQEKKKKKDPAVSASHDRSASKRTWHYKTESSNGRSSIKK